jgi:hypothetical protein
MSTTFKAVRPLSDFLRVLIAPAIWFLHLVILYSAEALICIGPPAAQSTAMAWMVFLATAAALTGLIILAAGMLRPGASPLPSPDRRNAWLPRVSLLLTLLSVLGVIWTAMPTALLPVCRL